jgi:hypothetical protein
LLITTKNWLCWTRKSPSINFSLNVDSSNPIYHFLEIILDSWIGLRRKPHSSHCKLCICNGRPEVAIKRGMITPGWSRRRSTVLQLLSVIYDLPFSIGNFGATRLAVNWDKISSVFVHDPVLGYANYDRSQQSCAVVKRLRKCTAVMHLWPRFTDNSCLGQSRMIRTNHESQLEAFIATN